MALKTVDEITSLWNQINLTEQVIKNQVVPSYIESLSHYIGETSFKLHNMDEVDVALNDTFPIVQQKLPFLFFRRPRAFVKPRRKFVLVTKTNPITGQREKIRVDGSKLARTTEHALNWNLHESGFEEEMDRVSLDLALSPYAVLWQSYAGKFGLRQDETMYVKEDSIFQKRIRPDLFLWDTEGTHEEEWSWVGRKTLVKLEDVLDDPRYSSEKRRLEGSVGFGDPLRKSQGSDAINIGPRVMSDLLDSSFKESIQSRRVWLYEIWQKPRLRDRLKGRRGKVFVLARDLPKPLFEDSWPLKQEGFPCELFRINPLNDSTLGIPDPKTYLEVVKEKQIETNLILRNLKQNSNLKVILNGSKFDESDVRKFVEGESAVLLSRDPLQQGDVTSLQAGSVPSAAFQVAQNTDMQLQKQSAITQTRQGIKPPGEITATQAEILERGLESRPTLHQKLISRTLKKLMRKRVQLMKQFFKRQDIVPVMGTLDFEWSDEFSNDDITDEVDIEVDLVSMLPENPAVEIRNLLDMLRIMSDAMANPAIITKIQQEGHMFNFTPFIEQLLLRMNLRNEEMFRPVRPEEGEGFSPNSSLLLARQRAIRAIITGEFDPPQPGENHDVMLSVYQSLLQLLQAIQAPVGALPQLIQATELARQQEEESSGKRKAGTPVRSAGDRNNSVPTRASEASRAQQRVQRV